MRIATILAARNTSTRLPSKALLDFGGVPMLEWIIARLRTSTRTDDVILATSESSFDAFKNSIDATRVPYYLGSEDDVLGRYREAAATFGVDVIVRATGDNPFVCVECLDSIIDAHLAHNADVSHYVELPYGAGVEVISRRALDEAALLATDAFEREHITQYMYRRPDRFTIFEPLAPERYRGKDVRLTVDTREDYDAALRVLTAVPTGDIPSIITYYTR